MKFVSRPFSKFARTICTWTITWFLIFFWNIPGLLARLLACYGCGAFIVPGDPLACLMCSASFPQSGHLHVDDQGVPHLLLQHSWSVRLHNSGVG
jgi:hypothetical protein